MGSILFKSENKVEEKVTEEDLEATTNPVNAAATPSARLQSTPEEPQEDEDNPV